MASHGHAPTRFVSEWWEVYCELISATYRRVPPFRWLLAAWCISPELRRTLAGVMPAATMEESGQ